MQRCIASKRARSLDTAQQQPELKEAAEEADDSAPHLAILSQAGSGISLGIMLPPELITHTFAFLPSPFCSTGPPFDFKRARFIIASSNDAASAPHAIRFEEITLVHAVPLVCRSWRYIALHHRFYDTLNLEKICRPYPEPSAGILAHLPRLKCKKKKGNDATLLEEEEINKRAQMRAGYSGVGWEATVELLSQERFRSLTDLSFGSRSFSPLPPEGAVAELLGRQCGFRLRRLRCLETGSEASRCVEEALLATAPLGLTLAQVNDPRCIASALLPASSSSLKQLTIGRCNDLTATHLSTIATHFTALKALTLEYLSMSEEEEGVAADATSSLAQLRGLSQLVFHETSDPCQLSEDTVCAILQHNRETLTQLELEQVLTKRAVTALAQCENLTDVRLVHQGAASMDDFFNGGGRIHKHLRVLHLGDYLNGGYLFPTEDEEKKEVELVSRIKQSCPALTDLSLHGVTLFPPGFPTMFADWRITPWQALGRLRLYQSNLTNEAMKEIAMGCPQLRDLFFSSHPEYFVTSLSLLYLGKFCSQLHSLRIAGCPSLGNDGTEGWHVLGQRCPLRRLVIRSPECSNIPDESLEAFLTAGGCVASTLRKLVITGQSLLSNRAVEAVAKHCSVLRALSLDGNRQVDDAGIRLLCGTITSRATLEVLSLEDCPKITWKAVKILSNSPLAATLIFLRFHDQRAWPFLGRFRHLRHLQDVSTASTTTTTTLEADTTMETMATTPWLCIAPCRYITGVQAFRLNERDVRQIKAYFPGLHVLHH